MQSHFNFLWKYVKKLSGYYRERKKDGVQKQVPPSSRVYPCLSRV